MLAPKIRGITLFWPIAALASYDGAVGGQCVHVNTAYLTKRTSLFLLGFRSASSFGLGLQTLLH